MNDLLDKLKKNSTIKESAILSRSNILDREMTPTPVPMINVALSGDVDGGMQSGILQIAGPSRHFKSMFSLIMVKAYMDKYDDAVLLFYDNEFGSPKSYFDAVGIDKDRILHCPIIDIEQLKHDIVVQLKTLERKDHVIIFIDSIGNVASIKEIEDAEEGKSTVDMTRAKQMKSLFRMITPHLTIKDIPLVVVNHVYATIETYSKLVPSGGNGSILSANDLWIIGRQKETEGDGKDKETTGYNFTINIYKSRLVKENSKIDITVSFDKGLNRYTGLFEQALEAGIITSPSKGWYEYNGQKYRKAELWSNGLVMEEILAKSGIKQFLKDKYQLENGALITEETGEVDDE